MKAVRSATAFAPATVANVAVGFDLLGFAVESIGDYAIVSTTERPTISVREIIDDTGTINVGEIPTDPARNTATVGLMKMREDLGIESGFEVSVRKGIALGSGMGGSAASAVAALTAANSLLDEPLPKEALLEYALLGERAASGTAHPDNVTPCLFGGLTLVTSVSPLRLVRLPVPAGLLAVVARPHGRVDTRAARGVLDSHVTLAAHVRQSANLAGFVAGCYTDDLGLIRNSLSDVVIEPQRAPLIPAFAEVKAAALEAGAVGCSISGSGPSVFAWAASGREARLVREAMVTTFRERGATEADSWISPVGGEGARVVR